MFEVRHRSNEAQPTNQVLGSVDLQCPGTDIQIGLTNRAGDLFDGHPAREHGFGVDVDLILLNVAPDRGHLGNAGDGLQREAHRPVLRGAKLVQVPSADGLSVGSTSLEGVPEHLAERGGVWPERRRHIFGEGACWERSELF